MKAQENNEAIIKDAPTVLKFINKLKSDKDLAAKYTEIIALNDEQAITGFMKDHGVSDEDIKSLLNRELSDKELDEVNGGAGMNTKPIVDLIVKIIKTQFDPNPGYGAPGPTGPCPTGPFGRY